MDSHNEFGFLSSSPDIGELALPSVSRLNSLSEVFDGLAQCGIHLTTTELINFAR